MGTMPVGAYMTALLKPDNSPGSPQFAISPFDTAYRERHCRDT